MEPLSPFLEYGVAIFAISSLVYVIRIFMKHLATKDEIFSTVINNHLDADKVVKQGLVDSNRAVVKSLERFEGVLDKLVDKL